MLCFFFLSVITKNMYLIFKGKFVRCSLNDMTKIAFFNQNDYLDPGLVAVEVDFKR